MEACTSKLNKWLLKITINIKTAKMNALTHPHIHENICIHSLFYSRNSANMTGEDYFPEKQKLTVRNSIRRN